MPELTVVVEQSLAPVPGGTGRYALQITSALAAQPPPGWQVRTVTAWHRDVRAAAIAGADGPRRLPVGHRGLNELWLRGWPPIVRGARVHATTPLAPRRRDGLVVTVHDAVAWTHPETLTPRGVRWHRAMIERAVRLADAIVVPSTAVADDLVGVLPGAAVRVHVIGHGVTPLDPPGDAEQRRFRHGLPDSYVLSVATLEPRKGLDVLIEAMAGRAAGGAHLVVVGQPGWGGVNVAAFAASAGLAADRLHVLGRIPDADLAAVLAGASVLAVPSRAEGFGLPALEAMAAGVPVVSSDAPALVELLDGAGIVVPRGDPIALGAALRQVVDDPSTAAALATAGRRRATGFSWSAAADRLWELHTGAPAGPG